jgi:mersacidin/lichenicidin family type 2 lantibiotic
MKLDVVRTWKDENYRQSLSEEQLNLLPANPAGELELSEAELQSIYGGQIGFGSWGGLFGFDGFGSGPFFGNFNRFVASNRCSRNCSFGCDIIDRDEDLR